jgi:predicted nucleic acid-binding Zn ribbon protein
LPRKNRHIATVLADALRGRVEARAPAAAAAFAEALGWPLSREAQLRGLTRDGRLIVVVRSAEWAEQLRGLGPVVVARVNARLGPGVASGLEIRVGPVER